MLPAVGGLLWFGLVTLVVDPEQIVVLPRFEDGIPVPMQRSLAHGAGETLTDHGVTPRVEGQTECEGVSCAEALDGGRGVMVSISRVARDYTVTAQVLAPDGSVVREETRVCKICRHDELTATVSEAVDAVAVVFDAPPTGTLSVVSKPSGATVVVDGVEVGQTPLEVQVPVGSRQITVEAQGRKAATQTAEIVEGEVARHAFSLSRGPALTPRAEVVVGWSAVALGVAAVASGVALLAIDGRPKPNECADACRYHTLAPGAGLLVGGVVVGGGGGALVWHGRRRGRGPGSNATLGPGGIRGRF